MKDPVTNTIILQHMQIMKSDLEGKIQNLQSQITGLSDTTKRGFREVRQDIRA